MIETDPFSFLVREYQMLWDHFGIESLREKEAAMSCALRPNSPSVPASLDEIRNRLGEGCGSCLCGTKKRLVFGGGNPRAELVFVGEAPGAEEDASGLPFVGRAGQLLTKIIEAMGYRREEVYITNVVKCRPPENRAPLPDEIECCVPILRAQLDFIHPRCIVALGATAAGVLIGGKNLLSTVRGRFHPLHWDPTIQVMPTYHPAYLLRNPAEKKTVWEDLKQVKAQLETRS